ncbi:hypothetical protein COHA_003798 [Chlorella ohadii]|uniref:Uncharacterized protein n=1 Tax=Chlorella ohadii TaxID=2649997 RepID=A0AAD5DSW8_9CHLO|nr:hypothetical protein COHA_003798 [Chlorella ohadii]
MAQLATTTCFKAASGRAPPQPQRSVRRRRLATAAAMPQQPAQAELDCQPRSWARAAGGWAAGLGAACLLLAGSGSPAEAARLPPVEDTPGRCDISALDKFADTRATFSLEASGGNMVEAIVDIRGCDYSNKDLSGKVLSGVSMQGSNFSGSKLVGSQFARASAQGAEMRGTDLTDVNAFATAFDGADLEGAQFENSILSNATFGQYEGKWANLKGAHFEGALLSSSDVGRLCENPTLDEYTRKAELGCRGSRRGRARRLCQKKSRFEVATIENLTLAAMDGTDSGSGSSNEQVVRRLLMDTKSVEAKPPDLSDDFHMRCNGIDHDLDGFRRMWNARKKLLQSVEFEVLDLFGRGDSVAAVRCAHVTGRDGSQQPKMVAIDIWRLQDGKVVAAEQCWQLIRGPAGDDIEITAEEGRTAELRLACVQHTVEQRWSHSFRGRINGVEFDFHGFKAHWEALQDALSTLLVEVRELVVSRSSVGVVYDVLCGRRGERQPAQLRAVAVIDVGPDGRIASSQAVVRLVSGSPADESLATLMPDS